jgi:hypothetical protein
MSFVVCQPLSKTTKDTLARTLIFCVISNGEKNLVSFTYCKISPSVYPVRSAGVEMTVYQGDTTLAVPLST